MGLANSKEVYGQKVDEACCTSVSKCRYVTVESPKWKVFSKREIRAYPIRTNIRTGCPCGAEGACKQKVTPKGVIIHYPQKCNESESYVTVPSIGVYINKRNKQNENSGSNHRVRYGRGWKCSKKKKYKLPSIAMATFKPRLHFPLKLFRDINCNNTASLQTENVDENEGYGDGKPKIDLKKISLRLHEKIIKKMFFSFMEKKYKPPKTTGFLSDKDRGLNNKVKIVKKRTFPPWKLDTKVVYNTKSLPNNTNKGKRRLFSKKQPQTSKQETKSEMKPPLRNESKLGKLTTDSRFSKFVRKDAAKKLTDRPIKKEAEKQSKKDTDEKSKSKKESNKKEAKEKREAKPNEENVNKEDSPEKMQLRKDTNEKESTKKSSNKKEFIRKIKKESHKKDSDKIPPSEIGDANNQQKLANEAEPHRNEAGES